MAGPCDSTDLRTDKTLTVPYHIGIMPRVTAANPLTGALIMRMMIRVMSGVNSWKQKHYGDVWCCCSILGFADTVSPGEKKKEKKRSRLCSWNKQWRQKQMLVKPVSDEATTNIPVTFQSFLKNTDKKFSSAFYLSFKRRCNLTAADNSPLALPPCCASFNITLVNAEFCIFAAGRPHWYLQLPAVIQTHFNRDIKVWTTDKYWRPQQCVQTCLFFFLLN